MLGIGVQEGAKGQGSKNQMASRLALLGQSCGKAIIMMLRTGAPPPPKPQLQTAPSHLSEFSGQCCD